MLIFFIRLSVGCKLVSLWRFILGGDSVFRLVKFCGCLIFWIRGIL